MTLHTRLAALCGVSLVLAGSYACTAPSATITNMDGSEFGDDDDDDDVVGDDDDDDVVGDDDDDDDDVPDPYPRSWDGERVLTFENNWCEDSIFGTGIEVTREAEWADALAACPQCDEIYSLTHSPDRICDNDIEVGNESVKGVNRNTGALYQLSQRGDQPWEVEELATGAWDETTLEYWYEVNEGWTYYEVDGWVTAE